MCISHGDRETSDKIWFSKEILSFTVNTIKGNRNSWNIFFISWSNVTGVDLFTLLFSLNKIYTSSLLALCMLSLWNHNFRKIVWKKNRVIQYLCLCKFLTDYLGLLTAILPLAIYKTLQNLLHKSSGYLVRACRKKFPRTFLKLSAKNVFSNILSSKSCFQLNFVRDGRKKADCIFHVRWVYSWKKKFQKGDKKATCWRLHHLINIY